jgi:hypothetical protein
MNMSPLAPRPLGSAPDARAYFLLSCQKKVAKEKARPQRRPASPGALRCSAATGGCGTRGFAPQTVLALFPVAPCAARRRKGQIENRSSSDRMARQTPFGVLFLPPRAAPSNGVGPGVVGEDCLRAKPEFRSRPASRVALGSRHSRPRNAGVAFFLVTFSWRNKKKLHAVRAEQSISALPQEVRCHR